MPTANLGLVHETREVDEPKNFPARYDTNLNIIDAWSATVGQGTATNAVEPSFVAGELVLDITTNWGIDSTGDVYYDPGAVTPGEEAVFEMDDNGSISWIPIADIGLDHPSSGGITQSQGDARYWQLSTDLATQTELNAHDVDTTAVHGIADTANLVLTSDHRLFTDTDGSTTRKIFIGTATPSSPSTNDVWISPSGIFFWS